MDEPLALLALAALAAGAWWMLRQNSTGNVRSFTEIFSNLLGVKNAQAQTSTQASSASASGQERTIQEAPVGASFAAWVTPALGRQFDPAFQAATAQYNLPPGLLSRMALQESSYNPQAVSSAGAKGLMQFTDIALRDYPHDPFDPDATIDAAGNFMADLFRRFGDWRLALAAYNWGQGNVAKFGSSNWPAETTAYVSNIANDLGL